MLGSPASSGTGEQLVEEFRAQGGHDLHRAGQRRPQQVGEPGPLGGRGLGEQLLELVHHDQQMRAARSRPGQQQVVGELGQPTVVEPAADLGRRPAQPAAGGRWRRVPGSAPPPAGSRAGSPAPSASRVRRPSPAAARPAPATTSRTPTGPPPAAPHPRRARPGTAAASPAARSPGCGRRTPGAGRCRTAATPETAGGHPASPPRRRRPRRRNASASCARATRMSVAASARCTAFSSGWSTPGSARTGSSRLPRVCAIASSAVHQTDAEVGRGQQAHHRVGPAQPLMQPLLPLLPHHDAVAQILIQEHLVAVLDQPPVHLTGQRRHPRWRG